MNDSTTGGARSPFTWGIHATLHLPWPERPTAELGRRSSFDNPKRFG